MGVGGEGGRGGGGWLVGGQPAVVAKYRGEMNRRISKCQLGVHTMFTLCTMYIYKEVKL